MHVWANQVEQFGQALEPPLAQHLLIRAGIAFQQALGHANLVGCQQPDEFFHEPQGRGDRLAGNQSRRPDVGHPARLDLHSTAPTISWPR